MAPRINKRRCLCANSTVPLSSTLLFLSWILPSSTFAQGTNTSPPPADPSTSASTPPNSALPTRILTSVTPTSTSPPSAQSDPPNSSSTSIPNSPDKDGHAFNYYFLIVAIVAVLICMGILYIGRRKKRKAAIIRNRGQHALARDVEGWRNRFGVGRGAGSVNSLHGYGRDEGLDERGEAPPPYAPPSKPPSIRSGEGSRPNTNPAYVGMQNVELGVMDGSGNRPPGYHEHVDPLPEEDIADIRRPSPAVTAGGRFGSTRGLLSDTGSSTQP